MRTILEFSLDPTGERVRSKRRLGGATLPQTISMPAGAKVVGVSEREESPVLMVLANPDEARSANRQFRVVRSDMAEIEDTAVYLGSAALYGGRLTLHVFEVVP